MTDTDPESKREREGESRGVRGRKTQREVSVSDLPCSGRQRPSSCTWG